MSARMDAVPILIFWLFVIWGLVGRPQVLLYLFFCSMPFGAFAVVPPALTAGLTFTPAPMVTLIIIVQQLANRKGLEHAVGMAFKPSRLMLLFMFWIVAVIATLFMPRLFAGHVSIIPMRSEYFTYGEALHPTMQNISQLAYLTISVAAVFALSRLLRYPETRQIAMSALVAGSAVTVLTGLLDFSTQFVPITPLLEPFRTATYALLTDVEILGNKRVVGLMPEASAFGGVALFFLVSLYFFRRAMQNAYQRDRLVPPLMAALFLLSWLSTSSAAYVGLAIFGLFVALEWLWRAGTARQNSRMRKGLVVEFWMAAGAATLVCAIILFMPQILDPLINMIDTMVFQKTGTSSFEERSMWTAVSWKALLDTWGLGVGLGGTRASNAIVSVASNTGFLGAFLYYGFALQSLARRARPGDIYGAAMISAVRWSFPPGLIIGVLVGTSPDFGAGGAFRYGLTLAIAISFSMNMSQRKLSSSEQVKETGNSRMYHVR